MSVVKLREFRENKKNCDNSDLLRKTRAVLQTGEEQGKASFLKFYSSRFLDGFERLSAEATFCTPAHTEKMQPLLAGYGYSSRTIKAKFEIENITLTR